MPTHPATGAARAHLPRQASATRCVATSGAGHRPHGADHGRLHALAPTRICTFAFAFADPRDYAPSCHRTRAHLPTFTRALTALARCDRQIPTDRTDPPTRRPNSRPSACRLARRRGNDTSAALASRDGLLRRMHEGMSRGTMFQRLKKVCHSHAMKTNSATIHPPCPWSTNDAIVLKIKIIYFLININYWLL